MRICPNLSDPVIKAQWDALINDPALGRLEAMREFIEAEKEGRAVGSPQQVKDKLENRFRAKTIAAQEARINDSRAEIVEKSNDPVYDDPDTLMGNAILSNPINGEDLSVNSNSTTRAMEIIGKLSQQTGIKFAFVTPDEAIQVTNSAKNPYNAITKGSAFFYGDTVYFVGGILNTELAFHEFSHPIIRTIKDQNPELFKKLWKSAISTDRTFLEEAYSEYADLRETIEEETDPEKRLQLENKYEDIVAEEVLVKVLTRAAMLKETGQAAPAKLSNIIKDLLYSIKQILRKVFGSKINISKLDVDTTMDQMAEMLYSGGKFDITTDNVDQADVVAYFEAHSKYINDLKNVAQTSGHQVISTMTNRIYEGASQQVRMIMKNKNYSEMINLFADEYNRGDLQEMRSNLAKYSKDLINKSEELAEDIERTQGEIQALVNSMLRLEIMMKKMEKHLDELSKDPSDKDNIHKAYYYSHVLSYWQKYIAETNTMMLKAKVDSRSPIRELLNSIEKTMENSASTITQMSHGGVANVLWDQWEDMATQAETLFKEQIASLKKRGSSKQAINNRFVDFYGMSEEEFNTFNDLNTKKNKGEQLTYDQGEQLTSLTRKSFEGKQMTKEKVQKALKGETKDANWFNSYLEGYLYNTDPVIGGFAMYFKNNMAEMEVKAQSRLSDIMKELQPLIKDMSFTKIGDLGQKIGFTDSIGFFDKDANEFVEKKVWTLLNPYKNYRYEIDKLNHDIKDLQDRYNKTGNEEDKTNLANTLAQKADHMRKYFHQEYKDEYYSKDDLFERDQVGRDAAFRRKKILEKMSELTHPLTNEYDILKTSDQMDALWKEYRLLYSLYYPNGEKKTNSYINEEGNEILTNDLAIAQRLQEHRDATRKFHEFKERPGVFQNALRNFEAETYQKLVDQDYKPGSDDFEDVFSTYRKEWIERNTRIVIKPEFYTKRTAILTRIKAITSKLPQAAALDFSEDWKVILDVVSAYRDDDGQPVGTDISDGRKQKVKEAQEAMERAKEMWAGFSGLTSEQMELLTTLAAKKNAGITLSEEEFDTYRSLLSTKNELGLDELAKAEINSLFAQLRELQRKEPTEYYLDAVNHWLEVLDTDAIFKEYGITELNETNIDKIFNPKVLSTLFSQSPDFKAWFEKNHIQKKFYNKETKQQDTTYERLFVWNVIKPNDPTYYETTQITNEDGTTESIDGLPSLKYYARVVKKEYRTGYAPATKEVKKQVGIHIDNRGEYLPKDVPGSPYRNEEYFRLKNADPSSQDGKLFKVLENITKNHLKNQEGIGKRGKLYLDFPRFEKSNLEVIQTGGISKKARETGSTLSLILKRFKDFFKGSKADAGHELNYKEKNMLVRADAFDDQIEDIPIQGLYNLDYNETSTDIISSMMRYMFAGERHKQLVKMNPVARGLQNVLKDPENLIKELNQVNRSNFVNNGVITYLNKKGKYIRKDAFNNFYDREFLGEVQTGAGKELNWLQNLQKLVFKRSSFAFFALNIPSALKNAAGAKFQAMIESAAGNNINPMSLVKGEAWSTKYMTKLSFGDAYTKGQKSLEHQLGEIFDPIQGRFQEKFGESITRTMGKDIASMSWLYNFRKWTEIQAGMQTFGAMMYRKKIKVGDTEIDYMDAWELAPNGKIQLKAGIDPKWGITYDVDGNPVVGEEFKKFRNRIHIVMNKLNGAYSKLDQPEMQRYIAFRFISYLRRYFTTMAMNRFSKRRWNPGYSEIDEGYYVTAIKALWGFAKTRNFYDLTLDDRKAWMKMLTEIGALYVMGLLIGSMWGWDDDDEDRFKKLRERSGPIGSEDFDLGGFMSLHSMNLMMQIRAENEQFIPWPPSRAVDNVSTMIDLKSLAFGPTTDAYADIAEDLGNMWEGNDKQFYKRQVGPYEWQDKGGSKLWNHVFKSFGITGTSIDPATAITNFQKNQARAK